MKLTDHVPIATMGAINSGLTAAKPETMLAIFGAPAAVKSVNCEPVTNPKLKAGIVSMDLGPFKATGHKLMLGCMERAFAKVKTEKPALYAALGNAGVICCRLVRGSTVHWSNHSFGFAWDMKISGVLVPLGADYVLQGGLELYPYLHAEGLFWAAGYHGRKDPMHFEVAEETIQKWHAQRLI